MILIKSGHPIKIPDVRTKPNKTNKNALPMFFCFFLLRKVKRIIIIIMGIYDEPYLLKHTIATGAYYNNPTAHTCKRNNS